MNVRNIVKCIVSKYQTCSPYELADCMNIKISRCELGTIRGYYFRKYRIKQIVLNCNLDRNSEKFVLAHELGHSILHPNLNTPFLVKHTFFSKNKYENEANKFAMELLIPDDFLKENNDCTIEQLSRMTGYHEKLIELRLK